MNKLLTDPTPITHVYLLDGGKFFVSDVFTEIKPYYEDGIWFAVMIGDGVVYRVPVSAVRYVKHGNKEDDDSINNDGL